MTQLKFSKDSQIGKNFVTETTVEDWFSRYIRLRDTDNNGNCRCFTCGKISHPKNYQCGHFVKRDRYNIKYHEGNVAAQCVYCNKFQDGAQGVFGINLDKKYGEGTKDLLIAIGRKSGKLKGWERDLKAKKYRKKTYIELKRCGLEKWW